MTTKRNRKPTPTRAYIIKHASELFFKNGFSKTTSTELCENAEVSKGNLTFYFPTKEHILAILVKMVCDYQWQEMENAADEGKSSLLAYCLQLTTMVSVCEDVEQMQDFFAAAYSHPMTLDILRSNGAEKIKQVFGEYTTGWSDEKYVAVEAIISGIEYASLMKTEYSATIEHRIEAALGTILTLLEVPEELRKAKIKKVLGMDYRAIGAKVYADFKQYVTETNAAALEEVLKHTKIRTYDK